MTTERVACARSWPTSRPESRRPRVPTAPRSTLAAVNTVELAADDRQFLWHPFTQQQGWSEEPPVIIERAEGTALYDTDGNAYIDGVSSLWCNVHGHAHHLIDAAVRIQLERLAHSTMLALSHPPAIDLARRLVELARSEERRVGKECRDRWSRDQ